MVDESVVIIVIIMNFGIIIMVLAYAVGYTRVPPNRVLAIFRGGPGRETAEVQLISGGGRFLMPGTASVEYLNLEAHLLEFEMDRVQTTTDGSPVKMRVKVAAIWKITSSQDILTDVARKLVGRTEGENRTAMRKMLDKTIREMAEATSLEDVESDRDGLAARIQKASVPLKEELGLEIRSIVLLKVSSNG